MLEASVHVQRKAAVVLATMLLACASGGPRHFGEYTDLAPKVAPQEGERLPQHLTVQIARPANVAVFLVMPGRGSTLLFPADSAQSGYMEGGSHLVETSYRRVALSDSGRLMRRPQDQTMGGRGNRNGGRGS